MSVDNDDSSGSLHKLAPAYTRTRTHQAEKKLIYKTVIKSQLLTSLSVVGDSVYKLSCLLVVRMACTRAGAHMCGVRVSVWVCVCVHVHCRCLTAGVVVLLRLLLGEHALHSGDVGGGCLSATGYRVLVFKAQVFSPHQTTRRVASVLCNVCVHFSRITSHTRLYRTVI